MLPKEYKDFVDEIRLYLSADNIYTDELRRFAWGTDASFYRMVPKVVVRTKGVEDTSKVIAACCHYNLPYTFRAAGTSLSGQSLSNSVLIVAGKGWKKYDLNSDASVISMQPGIIGAEVNNILKPYNRIPGPDPARTAAWLLRQHTLIF